MLHYLAIKGCTCIEFPRKKKKKKKKEKNISVIVVYKTTNLMYKRQKY